MSSKYVDVKEICKKCGHPHQVRMVPHRKGVVVLRQWCADCGHVSHEVSAETDSVFKSEVCGFCRFKYGTPGGCRKSESGEFVMTSELRPQKDGSVLHVTSVFNRTETVLITQSRYSVKYCPKCGRKL